MAPVRTEVSNGVAVLVIDNPPVNALGAAVRGAIAEGIAAAAADPAVKAVVLAAAGKVFVAGADISEFGKPPVPPALPDMLAAIEDCPKPVVAAVNGMALGGGLELALACHARVVAPGARLGLPEIKLGIIPGAGGTQRLPRLIGATPAFGMMLSGDPVTAQKALALGLADAISDGDLLAAAIDRALGLAAAGTWPRASERADKLTSDDRAVFEAAATDARKRSARIPNVPALIDAVRGVFERPFAEGLAAERAHFKALVADPSSKALRHVFFAEREAARTPGIGKEVKARPIASAAVVGAGTMGGGIAMCFAQAGIPVTLIEVKAEALDVGMERIRANYATSVKRGSLSQEAMDARMALITPKVGLEAAADADIVVEAAFEDMGVKAEIFGTLDRVTKPGTILATNTSYLDVDAIAATTSRPQDVVGLHFFSPANVMRLLEVVRGEQTAPDVLVTGLDLGRKLGKLPVVVGVCYGFVGNRILARRTEAAERLLLAGALPHEVDAAVTDFGFRMGPFAMADLAGIDIGWRARKAAGDKAVKAPVADALAEQGRFGQKTGRGFYLYPEGARAGTRDPETEALIAALSAERGIARRSFTIEEIQARLFYPMVNEGAKILEEGIAARSGDIDVIWLNGYNWPSFTGGPMHWAEGVGLARIVAGLEEMATETGDDSLKPAALLRRLAAGPGTFAAAEAA
ncbi:3-hydroxyacyl-CoA dehydrogenase NAD-binding domain-containing protein [Xanthobacter sp. YC-JY1]|uniref:3-hydroxyacyl-CoA dehydrogenase NAD-binding domain-containing protein n=1 Tax=Xanthobacter sp. YC-JY1 TaxID=2419844 RepID=UPI001F4004EE|nr:3-hydroxyacyl-CoA dehydrogenase NAD-binding domain-containing protein [Xanthobacter sp. YC-JY1]UJX44255.1 3-hydroxyacyl-CoA dehydrogenase [Xanthobacter sp. YC-JY1]